MDKDIHYIEEPLVLEVRDLEKRELYGRIVPFGETIMVRGRKESFTPASFEGIDATKTLLLRNHDPNSLIGRMTGLETREDGAYATFKVANTPSGDEALQLAREGVLDALSIGFIPGLQTRDGLTRIKAMPEVSLVTWGAYPSAQVLAIRNTDETDKEVLMSDIIEGTESAAEAVDLAPIEKRLEDLGNQLTTLQTSVNAPEATRSTKLPTPLDYFAAEVDAVVNKNYEKRSNLDAIFSNLETRDLDDITGEVGGSGDASGLTAEQYIASQIVNVVDARRPFFASLGAFPAPASGFARIPVVTENTEVAERAGQKQAANSRALVVTTEPFEAKWFDGAVDVALELIQSAEMGVLQLVWDDLLGQYALATEGGAIADVEAADVVYVGALDISTYADFAEDIAEQAIAVRQATGMPATKLAVPYAIWPSLVAFIDGNDRRQFTAGDHSDGNLSFTAEAFALPGGIDVFAAQVNAPMLYNQAAIRGHDYGPTRVQATNVELMGIDLGLLGRTMVVPRIPAGIIVFDESTSG